VLNIERPTTKGNGKWQISIGSQPPDDWIEGYENFIHFVRFSFFLSFFGTFFFIRFFHPDWNPSFLPQGFSPFDEFGRFMV